MLCKGHEKLFLDISENFFIFTSENFRYAELFCLHPCTTTEPNLFWKRQARRKEVGDTEKGNIMSVNRCFFTGNLTRDAHLAATSSGTAVLDFGLAINDRRKNPQTGEWEDVANFFEFTMFGPRAEALAERLTKGMPVTIESRARYKTWEHDGQKRTKVDFVVEEIVLPAKTA